MSKFYTKYNRPPEVISPCGDKSLTDASCLADTDINNIIKRYNAGDKSATRGLGVFADITQLGDFADSLETIRKAREDFANLPSAIRDRFGNDPKALFDFLRDSANDDEAVRLGLKEVRTKEKTIVEQIVEGVTTSVASLSSAKEG